jgi:hypothetical protein
MGFMSASSEVSAKAPLPCHQKSNEIAKEPNTCDTCETTLGIWEQDATANAEVNLVKGAEFTFVEQSSTKKKLSILSLNSNYQVYDPPPRAILKATTPNTKTTVLLV